MTMKTMKFQGKLKCRLAQVSRGHAASSSSVLSARAADPTAVREFSIGSSLDGSSIVALESKHGNTRFEVWKKTNHQTDVLGRIVLLSFFNRPVYKAVCKVHSGCECVINSLEESRLLEWLRAGPDTTKAEHADLS